VAAGLVNDYHDTDDFEGFRVDLFRKLSTECPVDEEGFRNTKTEALTDQVFEAVMDRYQRHTQQIARQALPVISDVFLNQGAQYENIVVPITDGMRTMQVVAHLEKSYKSEGAELITSIEKYITLAIIDNEWKEHLREMDELRRNVQNAAIEQKDPLLIYKLESFNLFKDMVARVNEQVATFLAKAGLPSADPNVQQAREPRAPQQQLQTSRSEAGTTAAPRPAAGRSGARQPTPPQGPPQRPTQPVRVEEKIGRNDPCPCGSGKKYKQCHGRT
jgi:preprotein translocase subunit SecA